jgi:hypothetical protein
VAPQRGDLLLQRGKRRHAQACQMATFPACRAILDETCGDTY